MPVDTTRVISPRRTQKKLTEEELKDIDRKRLLGELSCAECRRLKLRCDKKLPCGSCYRRGCESICPLGILAAGQGTRFILADTEQLHEKIYEMSNRIRQLEDALAILQSTVSDQRHPLLTDDLLKVKFGSEAINAKHDPAEEEKESSTNKSIDSLGTLSLGSSGKMQYFGGSAGSETLMMRADEEADHSSDDEPENTTMQPPGYVEVEKLANLFPFTARGRPNIDGLELLKSFLPPKDRALQMCDSFIKHASYFFRPVKADELRDVLVPSIYNGTTTHGTSTPLDNIPRDRAYDTPPHALATLFFIFSLGCLLDLELNPFNAEAEKYYDLGRAALSLRPVYEPNMYSVNAMGLMATYHSLAGKRFTRDSAWCIMSFAAKLAQSVCGFLGIYSALIVTEGLIDWTADSSRWNMDPKTVQKRRNLFWEIFSADVSHSLALGRPPAIPLSYVDCEYPDDEAPLNSDAPDQQNGFWRMKHTFARDIYNSVADATLIAKSPSYSTILDLDRKVREISFPSTFKPYASREAGPEIFHSSSLSLRDFYASQHRTVTMLYLHRSFFAQAMLDHPTNPLLSPFAPSFLTAYRSASVIIKASAHLFERCGAMAMRLWFLMYHTFSAAVIVGTVVTRSPNSNIASLAMRDFNLALTLFERTAVHSPRAKLAMDVLRKLRVKANTVYKQYSASNAESDSSTPNAGDDVEDDLAIFGGQMKVINRKGKGATPRSSSTTSNGSAASSPEASSGLGASPQMHNSVLGFGLSLPDVHPALIRYLNQDVVRKTMDVPSIPPPRSISIPDAPVTTIKTPTKDNFSGNGTRAEAPYERPAHKSSQIQPEQTWNQAVPLIQAESQVDSFIPGSPARNWSSSSPREHRRSGYEFTPYSKPSGSTANQELAMYTQNQHGMNMVSAHGPSRGQSDPSGSLSQSSFSGMASATMLNGDVSQSFSALDNSGPSSSGSMHSPGFYGQPQQQQQSYVPFQWTGRTDNYNEEFAPYNGMGGMGMNVDNILGRSVGVNMNGFNWAEVGTNTMDPTGAVEMGLSSESGMDAHWITFMRDCGIMDIGEDV